MESFNLSPCVDSNPNGLNKCASVEASERTEANMTFTGPSHLSLRKTRCASVEASERTEANMTFTGPSHLDLIIDPMCLC